MKCLYSYGITSLPGIAAMKIAVVNTTPTLEMWIPESFMLASIIDRSITLKEMHQVFMQT